MVARPFPAEFMNIYQRLMAWFCFPLDVIWKHHMGERYCSVVKFFMAGFVAFLWQFYIAIFFMADNPVINPQIKTHLREDEQASIAVYAYYGFMLVYGFLGIANLIEIRRRKKAGIKLHSYYLGTPRFLPDRPIVHTLVIPVIDFLIGWGVFQIIRPFGIYLCIAAVFQRWIFKSIFKQERTAEMDRQDRMLLQDWKSGQYRTVPTSLVQVARNHPVPIQDGDAAFNERWKKVLKPPNSQTK
jgi:hypothetical protein